MKTKKTIRVIINEEDIRSMLKTVTNFAVTRFQKSVAPKLLAVTKNIEEGDKIEIKKSFFDFLQCLEELGSDMQDVLPLIEEVKDLEKEEEDKKEKEED